MRVRLLEPWRSRLLWLSLGFNLFALPAILAPLVIGPHHAHPPGPPGFENLVQRIAERLDSGDAAAFKAAMGKEKPWYELGRQKVDEAREGVAQAVAHEPYDPAAASAALQAMQEQMRISGTRFDESLAMAVGMLTASGRARLAESLRQRRP